MIEHPNCAVGRHDWIKSKVDGSRKCMTCRIIEQASLRIIPNEPKPGQERLEDYIAHIARLVEEAAAKATERLMHVIICGESRPCTVPEHAGFNMTEAERDDIRKTINGD